MQGFFTWLEAGLYQCWVDDPDGILTPETDDMVSGMNYSAHPGNSTRSAFCFVDGDEMTQLMWDDPAWDDDHLSFLDYTISDRR